MPTGRMHNMMEQPTTTAATLLYQRAVLVADELRIRQNNQQSVTVPADFSRDFFSFIDRLNLRLMEDKDNFFGYFLFQMEKELRFNLSDAAGVNFKGTRYILYFNPLLFLPLSEEQMASSIKHQILHVVAQHLIRARELRNTYSRLAINLAMDVVVNTYLDHLPPFSTTLAWVNMNYSLLLTPFEPQEN